MRMKFKDWYYDKEGRWLLYGFFCIGLGIFAGWLIWGIYYG